MIHEAGYKTERGSDAQKATRRYSYETLCRVSTWYYKEDAISGVEKEGREKA